MPLTGQVLAYMRKHCPLVPNLHLIVGCSGGPDSLALAHLLVRLQDELAIRPVLAHLNHGLRTGAAHDEERVRRYATAWSVPLAVAAVDVAALAERRGESIELAGRRARYDFFARVAGRYATDQLALGHQRRDQAETVLLNLLRGAGPAGLAGMQPVGDWPLGLDGGRVVRPLLAVDRAAIEAYLEHHDLEPARDPSNRDPAYLRNRIRGLLARLEEDFNRGVVDHLWQLAELVRDEDRWMEELAAAWLEAHAPTGDDQRLPLRRLEEAGPALRRRIYRQAFRAVASAGASLTYQHVLALEELVRSGRTGAELHLPGPVAAERAYDQLVLRRGEAAAEPDPYTYRLDVPGACAVAEAGLLLSADRLRGPFIEGSASAGRESLGKFRGTRTAYLDYAAVAAARGEAPADGPLQLTVRNRRPGDRFQPLGMTGRKKLKDFFIDEKVPAAEREHVPVVLVDDHVIWVVGHRIAEPFRVRRVTRQVLRLEACALDEGTVRRI